MKVFLGALLFLFLSIPRVCAISEFEWVDLQMMKICRINLVKSQFECKEFRGAWKSVYPLILEGIKPEDIPAVCYPVSSPLKNTMLFSIPGTGQVYQFNPSLKTFKRLDETFFRGYNFYAVQFIRKDSLYSMGERVSGEIQTFSPILTSRQKNGRKSKQPESCHGES